MGRLGQLGRRCCAIRSRTDGRRPAPVVGVAVDCHFPSGSSWQCYVLCVLLVVNVMQCGKESRNRNLSSES